MRGLLPLGLSIAWVLFAVMGHQQGILYRVPEELHMRLADPELAHVSDVLLSFRLSQVFNRTAAGSGRKLALLMMLKNEILHAKAWRKLFAEAPVEDLSIFVHAYNATTEHMRDHMSSIAGRHLVTVVPNVESRWCELSAVLTQLLVHGLADPEATHFFFVAHDALPLVTWPRMFQELTAPQSQFCLAGFGILDVPGKCIFACRPWWRKELRLKHHQWMALTREHAATIVHPVVSEAVASMYFYSYGHQPVCSDEVVPMLSLLLANASGFPRIDTVNPWSSVFPDSQALSSTEQFADWLSTIGVRSRCTTYAHWDHCSPRETVDPQDLARNGVLFLRTANVNWEIELQLRAQSPDRIVSVFWPNETTMTTIFDFFLLWILKFRSYVALLLRFNLIAAVLSLAWFSPRSPKFAVFGGFTAAAIGNVVACVQHLNPLALRGDL
mmetsp:Transcript_89266/g.239175  ORF Transcript_89266/g.239175 Transcript_89266/m.239175 type:complete len:441 (-) Transcript_89266:6-1328(-)